MLNELQINILDSVMDGPEVFYFVFAEVNFGGQVFSREKKEILVSPEDIIENLVLVGQQKLVECYEVDSRGRRRKVEIKRDSLCEAYGNYSCITVEEHFAKYTKYGGHEFVITELGRSKMAEIPRL